MNDSPSEPQQESPGAVDVRALYHRALGRRGFVADAAQQRAVERLQRLYDEWSEYKAKRRTRRARPAARKTAAWTRRHRAIWARRYKTTWTSARAYRRAA